MQVAWRKVSRDLRSSGQYDIYFSREGESHHSTAYPHFVFWNDFPIHFEPLRWEEAVKALLAFDDTLV